MNKLSKQTINGRYELLSQIGEGGYGQVYLANDKLKMTPCVLKRNTAEDTNAHQRFLQEARLLAKLEHYALPKVHDFFMVDNIGDFLVMDLIPGRSLHAIIQVEGKKSLDEINPWLEDLFSAVAYLHTNNIIHRDIKPDNILAVSDNNSYLVDFGIAKPTKKQNEHGLHIISQGYSSPEQYYTANSTIQSDIYSLGAVVYFLLTGKNPPNANERKNNGVDLPPLSKSPDLVVQSILEKALSLEPTKRWNSVQQFWQVLYGTDLTHKKQVDFDPTYVDNPLYEQHGFKTETISQLFTESILEMPASPAQSVPKKKKSPLLFGVIAFLLLGGMIGAFLGNRADPDTPPILHDSTETERTTAEIIKKTQAEMAHFSAEEWAIYSPTHDQIDVADTVYDPDNNRLYLIHDFRYLSSIDLETDEIEEIDLSIYMSESADFDMIERINSELFVLAGNDSYIYNHRTKQTIHLAPQPDDTREFLLIEDVIVDNTGLIYLLDSVKNEEDSWDDRLQIFSPSGQLLESTILPVSINAFEVDGNGNWWIGSLHGALWKKSPNGEWEELIDHQLLNGIGDMAFDFQGNLYITTYGEDSLIRYSAEGVLEEIIHNPTVKQTNKEWMVGENSLAPTGITFINNQELFLIDEQVGMNQIGKLNLTPPKEQIQEASAVYPKSITPSDLVQGDGYTVNAWMQYIPNFDQKAIRDTYYMAENNRLYYVTGDAYLYWVDLYSNVVNRVNLLDVGINFGANLQRIDQQNSSTLLLMGIHDVYQYTPLSNQLHKFATASEQALFESISTTATQEIFLTHRLFEEGKYRYELQQYSAEGEFLSQEELPIQDTISNFVIDAQNTIWAIDLSGTLWKKTADSSTWQEEITDSAFTQATDLYLADDGSFYISSFRNHALTRYTPENGIEILVSNPINDPTRKSWPIGEFRYPTGITMLEENRFILTDGNLIDFSQLLEINLQQ